MIDEELYRETFSKLRASDEAKREVFMKTQESAPKRRFPKVLRAAVIAVVLAAVFAVTASAAGTNLLDFVTIHLTPISDDGFERVMVDDDGNEWRERNISAKTELRDGRLILTAMSQEVDITDELTENGKASHTFYHGEHDLTVNVTGTLDRHFISTSSTSEGVSFSELPPDEVRTHADDEILGEESMSVILYEDEEWQESKIDGDSESACFEVSEENGQTSVVKRDK